MNCVSLVKFVAPAEHDRLVSWPGGIETIITRQGGKTRQELRISGPLLEAWRQVVGATAPPADDKPAAARQMGAT